jgi:CubicO group peptidase (beta-lactamase class C family)
LWATAACLLAVGVFALTSPTVFVRLITYPHLDPVTAVDWHRPQEKVVGRPGTSLPRAAPGAHGIDEEVLEQAIRYASETDSLALLVVHEGKLVLEEYYGGHTAGTRVNTASTAKTLLALAVGIAIQEGAISSVHAPAVRYLDEWAGDRRSGITVKNLLRMTSGLRNDDNMLNPFSDLVQAHLGDDLAEVVLEIPAEHPAGKRFEYSNFNTQLLAILLERATGTRLADYLGDRLWRHLGTQPAAVWLDREGGNAHAYCCFMATARDWARVGLLLLNQGRVGSKQVVPASWIEQMRTPCPLEPAFGMHLWLGHPPADPQRVQRPRPYVSEDVMYLNGRHDNRVFVLPSRRLVIVRIGMHSSRWDDVYLPNLFMAAMPAVD